MRRPPAILLAAYKTGEVDALIAAPGAAIPFTVASNAITVVGGLANIDVEPLPARFCDGHRGGLVMALSASGNILTVYVANNNEGALTLAATIPMTSDPGAALAAHFVPDGETPEPIAVLSSVGSGSELDLYTPQGQTYTLSSTITSSEALKNFVPVIESSSVDIAAVGTSIEHFALSENGGAFSDISLPFSGKTVTIDAGNGGNGADASVAAGGVGGMISGMSIFAGMNQSPCRRRRLVDQCSGWRGRRHHQYSGPRASQRPERADHSRCGQRLERAGRLWRLSDRHRPHRPPVVRAALCRA